MRAGFLFALQYFRATISVDIFSLRGVHKVDKEHGQPAARHPKGSALAYVQLFEWKWDDVAKECEDFLGPKGFKAALVSPPTEHIQGPQWWTRYQPVSYKLNSRSGNEAAFTSMVQRCKKAGVGIYADAVINHMANGWHAGGGTATGVGGSSWSNRNFPGLYKPQDFHHDSGNLYSSCQVKDYHNRSNVQNCDLYGLADLRTGSSEVQAKIAKFINHLGEIGVAGLRLDAAKHISVNELGSILGKVKYNMYKFLEVIGSRDEAVQPKEYWGLGDMTEFGFAQEVGRNFLMDGKIQWFSSFGTKWGLMPGDKATVFIDNHDTQRGHGRAAHLTHKSEAALYKLANIFMLADPYGYPQIMSSYNFTNADVGPPSRAVHGGASVNCGSGEWVCEHRWPAIANMVAWRASAGTAKKSGWVTTSPNQASFCRGTSACIAFNFDRKSSWKYAFKVTMPPGTYCNVVKSDASDCETVVVRNDHIANVIVEPRTAVAFHLGRKI